MNKGIAISLTGIIAIIFSLFLGYMWGKSSVKNPSSGHTVEIKLVKGDVIRDTIKTLIPYEVKVSVDRPVFVSADTVAQLSLWKDYYLNRKYVLDFSNDSIGTFKVNADVSRNKLISATSFIQPNIRIIHDKEVIYKVPIMKPWVMCGTSVDFRTNKLQFGLDIENKIIIGVSGIRVDDKYGYTFDFGIKF